MRHHLLLAGLAVMSVNMLTADAFGQLATGWKQHDMNRPLPPIVESGRSNLPLAPPGDAVILFDGTSLDAWQSKDGSALPWEIRDGAMQAAANGGSAYSKQGFADVQLHVEWATPVEVSGKGQGRGNSGVVLQGQFEVQILDSFENPTYADGQAGSIYGQYPPLVNVSRRPGEWQSYDIVFRAPIFNGDGSLKEPACMTVLHNGVLIQEGVRPLGPTAWLQHYHYSKREPKLPLVLQYHGNQVRFRNIWVRDLPGRDIEQPKQPYDPVTISLSEADVDTVVGRYAREGGESCEVLRKNGRLYFAFGGSLLEMIPHTPVEFGLRYTAGLLRFTTDEQGKAASLQFDVGGSSYQARRTP